MIETMLSFLIGDTFSSYDELLARVKRSKRQHTHNWYIETRGHWKQLLRGSQRKLQRLTWN